MTRDYTEQKTKHLEMIQLIIARMASNSFMLKGWSVTLLVGFLAVIDKSQIEHYGWVSLVPITLFWLLDAYFLHQERLFRKLYDHVRSQSSSIEPDFDMNTLKVSSQVACVGRVMFSNTIFLFYLALVAVSVATMVLAK